MLRSVYMCRDSIRTLKKCCIFNECFQIVKRELRLKSILGKQASDERLYLNRENERGGLKSMKDVCKETRLRVACYMLKSENRWIQAAWRRETLKLENVVVNKGLITMEEVGARLKLEDNAVQLDADRMEQVWKLTWKRVKTVRQKSTKQMKTKTYQSKEQKSKFFREQEKGCHLWLTENLHPWKTSSIMSMLEQMVEMRP